MPTTKKAIERLYGLPLDEFTAARNELVRRLRADGRRDEAAEVAELRKPVLSAWVVNQLARERRAEVRGLLDAAKGIRSGRSGAEERFREATDGLTRAARALLEAAGRSAEGTLLEVATTLRAGAATDPELLAAGTLTQPLEASGFGAMTGATVAPRSRRGAGKDAPEPLERKPRVDRARVEQARRRLSEARADARRLEREATEAERLARKARAAAEDAAELVADAERRLAQARTP